jgi:hypothetical protein
VHVLQRLWRSPPNNTFVSIRQRRVRRCYSPMMVRVGGALLRFTEYRRVISVDAATVEAALVKLSGEYQQLGPVLFDRQGRVRATHRIFLNGEPLDPAQLASPAGDADCVELLLAISGG